MSLLSMVEENTKNDKNKWICNYHLTQLGKYLGLAVDGLSRSELFGRFMRLKEVGTKGMVEFRLGLEGYP